MHITLTATQAQGLPELIALAERGRDDFLEQARYGDYTPADISAALTRWHAAEAAANALQEALAAKRFVAIGGGAPIDIDAPIDLLPATTTNQK